jgi:hypothetical protein
MLREISEREYKAHKQISKADNSDNLLGSLAEKKLSAIEPLAEQFRAGSTHNNSCKERLGKLLFSCGHSVFHFTSNLVKAGFSFLYSTACMMVSKCLKRILRKNNEINTQASTDRNGLAVEWIDLNQSPANEGEWKDITHELNNPQQAESSQPQGWRERFGLRKRNINSKKEDHEDKSSDSNLGSLVANLSNRGSHSIAR